MASLSSHKLNYSLSTGHVFLNDSLEALRPNKQPARVTQSHTEWSAACLEKITLGQRGSQRVHADMSNGKQLLQPTAKNTPAHVWGRCLSM